MGCHCSSKQINDSDLEALTEKEQFDREKLKFNNEKEEFKKEINKFNKDKNEFNKKREELKQKENGLKRKEEQLKLDNIKLNKKVEEYNKLNEELNKASRIKDQENIRKINEIKKKEEELKEMKRKVNAQNNEIIANKNEINKMIIELKEKEKDLNNKEKNIQEKFMKLNQLERDLKNKEIIIGQKSEELYQKEIIIQKREMNVDVRNMELNQKEKNLNNKELNLSQQMIEFEKNKEKIINQQNVPIIIGLNNIGATCYMNSTLQCLSNTKKLTEYFLTKYKQNPKRIMANVYHKLLLNLWNREKNNKPYSPYEFKEVLSKENPLFAGIAANDSKDLINFLIERFHQELNEVKENNNVNNNNNLTAQNQTNEQFMLNTFLQEFKEKFNSPISDLFYGMIETKSQCQRCAIIKYNFQVYSFLEFPLQQVNQYYYNMNRRPLYNNDGTNPDVDLYECFEYYQKIDLMNGDNQMYCNICNQLCDSLYSTTIYSTPINLIINLNRGRGAVYVCKVNFPEQLNLINYVTFKNGFTVYQLYAVICHLGPSSMSGHFVAYCRNRIDNKWYLYNDGMVSPCYSIYPYKNGMPYMLFYRAFGE